MGFTAQEWQMYGPQTFHAVEGGQVIGALHWYEVGEEGESVPNISKISVKPSHQRRGIASAMFDLFLLLHPVGEVYLGEFLPDGVVWWQAYTARRRQDRSRFTIKEGQNA